MSLDKKPAQAAAQVKESLPDSLLLSKQRGPAPAPGQPRAYIPPTATKRTEARETLYLRALRDISAARFAFPTEKHNDFKTHVNHPARTMGVDMGNDLVAYPDIVVVQHPENRLQMIAEVETLESVTEAVARNEWLPYSKLAPLYLFVPVGKAHEAEALCRKLKIPAVGIRTWRYLPSLEGIELTDHMTVPGGTEQKLKAPAAPPVEGES